MASCEVSEHRSSAVCVVVSGLITVVLLTLFYIDRPYLKRVYEDQLPHPFYQPHLPAFCVSRSGGKQPMLPVEFMKPLKVETEFRKVCNYTFILLKLSLLAGVKYFEELQQIHLSAYLNDAWA